MHVSACLSLETPVQTRDRTYRLPAPTDQAVLKTFEQLVGLVTGATFSVEVAGVRTENIATAADFEQKRSGNWARTRIISKAWCDLDNPVVSVVFQRALTEWDQHNHPKARPDSWENEIYLTWRDDRGTPAEGLRLEIAQVIAGFQKIDLRPAASTDAFTDAMASHVSKLADMQASILEDAEEKRRSNEEAFVARMAQLEADHAELVTQLRKSEYEAEERLSAKEASLESLKKQLDDRGHMHARRQLRTDITNALKARLERPGVSKQTATIRLAVVAFSLFGCIVFGTVAAISMTDLHNVYSASNPNIYIIGFASLRFALPAAAAAGLLFYALGWLRRLHAEDVHAERSLERYRYDLDRASWAIETILEAQGKEGGTVPPEWIAGVTHGLFVQNAGSNEDRDAADALGSLLNFAAKAEFGPGGPKLEFQKRDLRRLSREAAESS